MKHNIKIVITLVKICYSISFMVILAFIVGISSVSEIGAAMDANVALLAIIFCADTFEQELQANRWEVFYILPARSKYLTICQRILVQIAYLILLISIGYWVFFWHKPAGLITGNEMLLYVTTILACAVSAFFFAILSITLVNLFHNLWAGIGATLTVWFLMNPTFQNKISLPKYIDIFRYQNSADGWVDYLSSAKLTAVITAILLLILNYRLIIKGKERFR